MGYLKGQSSLMIFQKYGNMKFAYRNRGFKHHVYYVDIAGKYGCDKSIYTKPVENRQGNGTTKFIRSARPVYGKQVTNACWQPIG